MFQTLQAFQDFVARQAFGHTTTVENRAFDEFLLAIASLYVLTEDLVFRDGQLVYSFAGDCVQFETKWGPVRIPFGNLVDTGYQPNGFPHIPLVLSESTGSAATHPGAM